MRQNRRVLVTAAPVLILILFGPCLGDSVAQAAQADRTVSAVNGNQNDDGLILPDALRVLKTGNIFHEPECDLKTGDWKYRVEGREVDGKWLAIVFCFRVTDTVFLITVFSVEVKRK